MGNGRAKLADERISERLPETIARDLAKNAFMISYS
jgi:hypothetical protein